VDANEAVARRMHGLGLWGGASAGTPAEAVSRLAAMQGQEFGYALWGVAQRTRRAAGIRSLDARAMRTAFNTGELLRTHAVRPTWHLLARDDIDWMLRLLSPRVHVANAFMYRTTAVDDEVAIAAERAIATAVAGGPRTRAELAAALAAAGITGDGVRIGYLLMRAELDRVIVSGPLRGRQQTYADYDARVPVRDATDREHDLAELARRYFRTRGPASVKDFARWSGLTLADARRGHAEVASELVSDAVEHPDLARVEVWFEAADPPGAPPSPRLDLVQGYDECVMSYSETQALLFDGLDPRRSATPTLAAYLHTVLLDGRLAGHWKATPARSEVRIDVQLDDPLDDAGTAALETARADYADYLGLSLA
jgi:hypothetical protein